MSSPTRVLIYGTNENRGTVHLFDGDETDRWLAGAAERQPRSLCNSVLADDVTLGDETLSGTAASCQRCRSLAGIATWDRT